MPFKPLVTAGIESLLNTFLYRSPALKTARSRLLGKVLRVEVKGFSTSLILVFSERQVDVLGEWAGDADCTVIAYASVLPKLRDRQQLEKNSITSPNLFGVWGIILAYQHGLPWLDALNDYLQGNARYLADALQTHFPAWKMMTPESSYLAWIDVSADESSATQLTQHFARQAGVVIEDGRF